MTSLSELIKLLTLERMDKNQYLGQNYAAPWGRVFGGQVLAQSLHAAYQTVPKERIAHSMHGYFILVGKLDIPITYEVDTIRDGGSFTTRRVVAKQNGKAIFNMAASFQVQEKGVDHQITMPNIISPDRLMTSLEQIEDIKTLNPNAYNRLKTVIPEVFLFKPTERITSQLAKNSEPSNHVWIKTAEKQKIDLRMQHQILAYASDYNLLTTATLPHRETLNRTNTFYASLDHAIWFHRSFDIQDWLLYALDSPSASNARGFARGSFFSATGDLVASVAQEGLIRQLK